TDDVICIIAYSNNTDDVICFSFQIIFEKPTIFRLSEVQLYGKKNKTTKFSTKNDLFIAFCKKNKAQCPK
ncbi:MAG: hypothetical protein IKA60_04025, partial [Rikenellaceae bacterium]|nr:hypothetical protein [Rikenellaceae bacterium]